MGRVTPFNADAEFCASAPLPRASSRHGRGRGLTPTERSMLRCCARRRAHRGRGRNRFCGRPHDLAVVWRRRVSPGQAGARGDVDRAHPRHAECEWASACGALARGDAVARHVAVVHRVGVARSLTVARGVAVVRRHTVARRDAIVRRDTFVRGDAASIEQ